MSPKIRRRTPQARAPRSNDAEWLSIAEAAHYLGIAPQTLYKWRWLGEGPRTARAARIVRYRRADLDAWLSGGADGSAPVTPLPPAHETRPT